MMQTAAGSEGINVNPAKQEKKYYMKACGLRGMDKDHYVFYFKTKDCSFEIIGETNNLPVTAAKIAISFRGETGPSYSMSQFKDRLEKCGIKNFALVSK